MTLPGFFEGTGMPDAGWWEALFPHAGKILTDVGVKSEMEVVDLCSGDGWFTLPLSQMARHVFAIDIDDKLLEISRKRLLVRNIKNCDFITGDAFNIGKLCPVAVDFVFIANAFHGVVDRPSFVRAVLKSLKPNGSLAIVNWHQHPREKTTILGEPRGPKTELRLTPQQTINDAEAGGAKLGRIVEIPPYHYGAVFHRA